MKYDSIYFLKKFDAIPDDKWTVGSYRNSMNQRCAVGHCLGNIPVKNIRTRRSKELFALRNVLFAPTSINDGLRAFIQLGDTPKERIINALLLANAGIDL
jgi:hypothetical protein